MNLKKVAVSGFVWTFLDTVISRGVGIVASIVLARLLTPREFGLMGMIYIFTSISASLVSSGLTSSLIRSKQVNDIDYSTIFYTSIGVSLVLYGIVFLAAPLISDFYEEPQLVLIVRVYAYIFVITSFSSVQQCIFTKKMAFKKMMLLNIPGIVIGSVVGVFLAYSGQGVWSIIYMQLITQGIFSIMLWVMSDWKPTLAFSFEKLKQHYTFGYRIMLSGILNSVFDNIYNVLIGKFFSTNSLGQFERARTYNNYPVIILANMIGKVTYPLLSKVQDEKEQLANGYRQIIQFTFFVSAPLMLSLSAIAKPLFLFVIGPQWGEAVVFFQILFLSGMLYPVHTFNLNLLKVYGRSDWFLSLVVIKKILILVIVAITFHFGIYGLVWGDAISSFLALAINTYYTNKLINYSLWNQINDMKLTFLLSVCMFLIMYFLGGCLSDYNLLSQILIPVLVGFSFYGISHYTLKTQPYKLLLQFGKNL